MDYSSPASLPEKRKRVGKARGGRKKIDDSAKKEKRIILRFTEKEYAELKGQADQSGRPMAVIVRSRLKAQTQQQPWTAEQFRLCRQLADLHSKLTQLKKHAERKSSTLAEAKFGEAAEQVNKFLDSLSI
jgi:hypothetical protein